MEKKHNEVIYFCVVSTLLSQIARLSLLIPHHYGYDFNMCKYLIN